jgi:hypothetical protein
VEITFSREDIEFWRRLLNELSVSIEAATSCDGGPCNAPGAPHDTLSPHWHLRHSDLQRERLHYIVAER